MEVPDGVYNPIMTLIAASRSSTSAPSDTAPKRLRHEAEGAERLRVTLTHAGDRCTVAMAGTLDASSTAAVDT